jgi:hypothetical protein
VTDSFGLQEGQVVRRWPNLRASVAVFRFERCPHCQRAGPRGEGFHAVDFRDPDGSKFDALCVG